MPERTGPGTFEMGGRSLRIALTVAVALAAGEASARCEGVAARIAALESALSAAAKGEPGALEAAQRHAEALAIESMTVEGLKAYRLDDGLRELSPALRRAEAERRFGRGAAPSTSPEMRFDCDRPMETETAGPDDPALPPSWTGGKAVERARTLDEVKVGPPPEPLVSVPIGYAALALPVAGLLAWAEVRRRQRKLHARYLCFHPIRVRIGESDAKMTLVDFSHRGARISLGGREMTREDRITVDFGPAQRGARVRWSRGGNAGIRFDAPLREREFDALMAAARAGAGVEERGT